jgi:hypothetical protein
MMSDTSDSYDTSYDASYEVSVTTPTYDTADSQPILDPAAYAPTDLSITQTDSYSYDSTDWGAVAEVSEGYTDVFQSGTEVANALYQASTEAYLAGDEMGAYELNQGYLEASAGADQAWDAANGAWTDMAETTTVNTYDVASYDSTGYEAAPVDTSWSAAPVDTGYEAAPVDTSWSAAPVDTGTEEY